MPELRASVVVAAPVETVWAAMVDWSAQGDWMLWTTVSGGQGLNAELSARTGLGPFAFVDTMVVTTWAPPYRCVVRHTGRVVRGTAAFEVVPLPDGRARMEWTEWLVPPLGWLGVVGLGLLKPLLAVPLRYSLRRFARMVEARS